MDINDLRVVITVLAFVAFVGIVFWAYSRKRKHEFDEAASLPFTENDLDQSTGTRKETGMRR
ncbi:MAG TPA: CcoQ/FixQ family Cbb3-type cytochrome c oxidase assembly chaperone [Casimicrobiaceae bacterium]|nr:CcoQ/FixQ family Cbb3-type cytochrome c oxidase assembly chaperone [Casimicrobiaceae bacterium]